MNFTGSIRVLIIASALMLWIGAVATASEQTDGEEATPPVEASPPAAPADDAENEGGEAPAEEAEEASDS